MAKLKFVYPRGTYLQPRYRLSTSEPDHICSNAKWFLKDTLTPYAGPRIPAGTGSVNVYVEHPVDGSCHRIELHNVLYMPGYLDPENSEIHELIIARRDVQVSDSQRYSYMRVYSFTDDSGRAVQCLVNENMVIEPCRDDTCRHASRHCGNSKSR